MAVKKKKKSIALKIRNYFFTGVVVLIPIGFTLYLTKFLISISSKLIPESINPNTYLSLGYNHISNGKIFSREVGALFDMIVIGLSHRISRKK